MLIPGKIAGKAVTIKTDVVNSEIPLLLSKKSMKCAGPKIDFLQYKVSIFGKDISLHFTSSGHYAIPPYFSRKHIYIYEPYRIKRTQNSSRRFPPSFISLSSKSFVNIISYGPKITNYKDETINHSNIYFLLDLFQREKHFVKVCNTRKFDLSCSIKVSFREINIMYKAR